MPSSSEIRVSLDWLINPIGREKFLAEYWEKQPLAVRRDQKDYFGSLLSLDDVDQVITTLNLTYPQITLKNADKEVTAADYTARNGALDAASVYQLFTEGSSIVLAFLDTVLPSLTSLCRSLEKELCFPLQANVYLTPAGAKGAKYHYDTHDVFVLQISGSKRWTMYGTPVELPLSNQDFNPRVHEQGAPTMEFELEPGDVAYVPRGLVHDARSSDEVSLHITLGILCYRWVDLLLELVADEALNNSAFRKSLPVGFARENFDSGPAQQILRDLLHRLVANSNLELVLDRFTEQWISACQPLLRGQMDQIALLNQLKIDSVVGARVEAVSRVVAEGKSAAIYAFGRKISFPAYAAEAVHVALRKTRFRVRELPGDLDNEGKLVLIRRLILEGLVKTLEF
jgi:ribosomal protein L16 Arg81 hydroxylase